jgi:hypothetical protein
MGDNIPIVIIVIAEILVILAVIALRIRTQQMEGKSEQHIVKNKKAIYIPF